MAFDLPPPDPSIEFSIASRGYSKGVAQTDGAQLIVRPEITIGAVRLGAYAKNVTATEYEGEAGALIAVRKTFGNTEMSASAAYKHLLGAPAAIDRAAAEFVFAAAHSVGKLKPRVSLTYSPDDLGSTGRTAYWEAGSSYQIDKLTTASAGVGLRKRTGGPEYSSFNLGVTRMLVGPLVADVRLYDTSKSRLGDYFKRRVVVSVRARF